MIYKWKSQAAIPVGAQVAGEHLENLRIINNGQLTPRAVVDDARQEGSPLHPAFEWDDSVAAERFREEQARYMLRQITVVVPETGTPTPIRAFVNVRVEGGQSYTHVVHALSDTELRLQILAQAWKDLQSWREKYKELEELAGIFAAMDGGAPQLD
jgi:hypothetical protein